MKEKIIIEYSYGLNHCRLLRDVESKKLIVKGRRIKKSRLQNTIIDEYPDTEKGRKQSFKAYKETFLKIFLNTQNEDHLVFLNQFKFENVFT